MGWIRPCFLITAKLIASLVATADAQSFGCNSKDWNTYHAKLKCSNNYGGKSNAIELAHDGDWTHAYQEVDVVPNAVYRISGEFYPFVAGGDCDESSFLKVAFCSPSVAVCSGAYNGELNPVVPPELQSPPFPAGSAGCDLRSVYCPHASTHAQARLPVVIVQTSTTPQALAIARLRSASQKTHGLCLILWSPRWMSFASPCTSIKRVVPTPLW
jgi:hypothetical protein